MRSSKRRTAEISTGISSRAQNLHRRLLQSLSLGKRLDDGKKNELHFPDIEAHRQALRCISAFLDCLLEDASSRMLLQGAVTDIVGALVSALRCKSETTVSMAVNIVFKLINMKAPVLQEYILQFVHPLLFVLCSCEVDIATSCANTLNIILSDLNVKKEREVFEMLKERKTIIHVITTLQDFPSSRLPVECFQALVSLVATILCRWPSFRYSVWNDAKLMKVLSKTCREADWSTKIVILKLFSATGAPWVFLDQPIPISVAPFTCLYLFGLGLTCPLDFHLPVLCANGAKVLLENKETATVMVCCMNNSEPHSVRMEAFKLARRLTEDELACAKLMSFCSEPLVQAIVDGMIRESACSGKITKYQVALLAEACQLALVTRWTGKHHAIFWEKSIDTVLLGLLFINFDSKSTHHLSLAEQITMATDGLNANFLHVLKPYVWDILGWLAVHCGEEGIKHHTHENEHHLSILVTCVCLEFVEAIRKGHRIYDNDVIDISVNESASRAVFLMMNSPCKLFAAMVRISLSEVLRRNEDQFVERILHFLHSVSSGVNEGLPNVPQTIIYLAGFACFTALPDYRKQVIECNGIRTLITFLKGRLSSHIHVGRVSATRHICVVPHEQTCCAAVEVDWEGNETIFVYALQVLSVLVKYCDNVTGLATEICRMLRNVLDDVSASGPKWLAAHILSVFGFYGFPNNPEKGIGRAFESKELIDLELTLRNGESVGVHRVILAVQCPSLLPPEEYPCTDEGSQSSYVRDDQKKSIPLSEKKVQLSAYVDKQALQKLLEFIYTGYTEVGEELVGKLKQLAKSCRMQPLLQMLNRKLPKWGTPTPNHNFVAALDQVGFRFSDVMMESNGNTKMADWACSFCSLNVPHMHLHKIILSSRCEYFRALFQSGMQESHSEIIKAPVSWEALEKLVLWFYSYKLLSPPSGCLWDNMGFEEKLHEVQLYVELYWVAEFWVLEEIQSDCFNLIVSHLASDGALCVKIIQFAAGFSLWNVVEVAADCMAPSFNKLRDSGYLENLDEGLFDLVRTASVRFSQERGSNKFSTSDY